MPNLAKALILLSFLSIPNPGDVGLELLGYGYFALVLLIFATLFVYQSLMGISRGSYSVNSDVIYCVIIYLYLLVNFLVASLYGVETGVWLKRSIHLFLIPIFWFIFNRESSRIDELLKQVYYIGLIEVGLVFVAYFMYIDSPESERRRATDIEGVILYSWCMVYAAYYLIEKYKNVKAKRYLVGYFIILLAELLTESRILLLSTLVLSIQLFSNARSLLLVLLVLPIFVPLVQIGYLDRFDFSNTDHLITILSKIEEVEILFGYFMDSPIFGTGFGRQYSISIANSVYTYSHNMFLFYLAYGGIVGLLIALFPLIRISKNFSYWPLVMASCVFYLSNTTYTNVKHSIIMALLLIAGRSYKVNTRVSSPEPRGTI